MSGMTWAAKCDHGPRWHDGTEPFAASAPASSRAWLLIEHPGPWPRQPAEAPLPRPLRRAVDAAGTLGIRVQLIRRPHRRSDPAGPGRRPPAPDRSWGRVPIPFEVYAGWSAGRHPWLRRGRLHEPGDVDGLDLARLARGLPGTFGEPAAGPLLLVCTHGRRNMCCARLGRPLASELAERHGAAVWETSHVGGDRHAANLVILPHGLYYGPVDPPTADSAIGAYLRDEVILERYRGRAGQSENSQATEHLIRELTGLRGIDDVTAEADARDGWSDAR